MNSSYVFLAAVLITLPCVSLGGKDDQEKCLEKAKTARQWDANIIIRSKRNSEGYWTSDFDAFIEPSNSTQNLYIGLKQRKVACGERELLHFQGTLLGVNVDEKSGVYQKNSSVVADSEQGVNVAENASVHQNCTGVAAVTEEGICEEEICVFEFKDKLRFHSRHGENVAVSSDGKTAYRLNPQGTCCNAGVITHRLLRQDELFEVRLDNVTKKTSASINMGVTTYNPNNMVFIESIVDTKNGMWMFWGTHVIIDGSKVNSNYGGGLEKLRSGDLVGVSKKANGELHLYINGMDQGVAATDLPHTVYGILEVRGDTFQVSISDNASKIMP